MPFDPSNFPDISDDMRKIREQFALDEMIPGRYSVLFILSLWFQITQGHQNPWAVVEEIKFLESDPADSKLKRATQFRRAPLIGLWHKHVLNTAPNGIVCNIELATREHRLHALFSRLIQQQGEVSIEENCAEFAREYVAGYDSRRASRKLTGNWLVYAKFEGQNYYLAVCSHDEPNDRLAANIQAVLPIEFPEVNASLGWAP